MKEQILLFQKIKAVFPPNKSFVNEIGDLLGLSTDAVYRRIRGESVLSYDEALLLLNTYEVSIDSNIEKFRNPKNKVIPFRYGSLYQDSKAFLFYIQNIVDELKSIVESKHSKIILTGLDIPIFHYFQFSHLAKFKLHYWLKSIMNISINDKFTKKEEEALLKELVKLSKLIFEYFQQIPCVEIWTESTIDGFIRQLNYYAEIEEFPLSDISIVCQEGIQMLQFIQEQARVGKKHAKPENGIGSYVKYDFYLSDVMLGANLFLVEKDKIKMSFIAHQGFNSMSTFDETFYNENNIWLSGLMQRSTLLSNTAEKNRNHFFKNQIQKLEKLHEQLKNRK